MTPGVLWCFVKELEYCTIVTGSRGLASSTDVMWCYTWTLIAELFCLIWHWAITLWFTLTHHCKPTFRFVKMSAKAKARQQAKDNEKIRNLIASSDNQLSEIPVLDDNGPCGVRCNFCEFHFSKPTSLSVKIHLESQTHNDLVSIDVHPDHTPIETQNVDKLLKSSTFSSSMTETLSALSAITHFRMIQST